MSETHLATAVVGAGNIGEAHARIYGEHPLVDLEAVVDLDAERAETVAARHGANRALGDLDELFAAVDVDAVTVATPEAHHRGPTETALEHGSDVLLEKPIAESEDDGIAIGEAVESSDATLMMGYVCRFHPRYAALKAAIDDGSFGRILSVQTARISSQDVYRDVAEWTHPVYYLAVHDVDAMRWYVDEEVRRVYAEGSDPLEEYDVPAAVHATLRFDGGAIGVLEANWGRADGYPTTRTDEVRVTGTDRYARLHNDGPGDAGVQLHSRTGTEYADTTDLHGERQDFLRREVDHFVDCSLSGTEPLVTWEDGFRGLRVANAIRESIETGRPIELEPWSG